jgi:C4-dicarboxylate transporter DctM subunit
MAWILIVFGLALIFGTGALLGPGIGLTGFALLHWVAGGLTMLAVPAVWNVLTDFTLSAVPMFIFLGELLSRSGLSARLYHALAPLFARVPGGLLQSNVWVCASFGAISGSSSATAAAVGSVAYPALARLGYPRSAVVASLAGSGTLGLLIPPSLALLIYGATQEVSIGQLFLAGILPGLMMASLFSLYVAVLSCRAGFLPAAQSLPSWPETLRRLAGAWPLVVLMGAVLGTIYAGLATPTEAAGLGVAVAVLMVFGFAARPLRVIYASMFAGAQVFGVLSLVIMGTLILAQAVGNLALPRALVQAVGAAGLGPTEVLIAVVLVYLVLGCFFDGLSLMIMTLPLVFPLMTGFGYDPVWLGVAITLLIEIAAITPPVGVNLYVLLAITEGEVALPEAALATVPYWLLLLLGVALITLVPDIALLLPTLVFR